MVTKKDLYSLIYKAIRGDKPTKQYRGRGSTKNGYLVLPVNYKELGMDFNIYEVNLGVVKYPNGIINLRVTDNNFPNNLAEVLLFSLYKALKDIPTIQFCTKVEFIYFKDYRGFYKYIVIRTINIDDNIVVPSYKGIPVDEALGVIDSKLRGMSNYFFNKYNKSVSIFIEYSVVKDGWVVSIFSGNTSLEYFSIHLKNSDYSNPCCFNFNNVLVRDVYNANVVVDNNSLKLVFDYLNYLISSGICSLNTEFSPIPNKVRLTDYRTKLVGDKTITNKDVWGFYSG